MITASLASIFDRRVMLENTITSLWPQVDRINVILNDYRFTPEYLNDKKIKVYHLNNIKGDAGKFYDLPEGEIFLCDDDLIYPPDYVLTMLWKLSEYDGQAIITNMGKIFKPKPICNYHSSRDRLEAFHWNVEVLEEKEIQVGGTGVMCFDTRYFKPKYEDVTIANMADLWVAKWAKEQGKRIIINPHPADWITYQEPEHTIYDDNYKNPELITQFFNSF